MTKVNRKFKFSKSIGNPVEFYLYWMTALLPVSCTGTSVVVLYFYRCSQIIIQSTPFASFNIKFNLSLRINTSKPCGPLCSDFPTSYFFFVLPRIAEGLRFAELLVRVTLAVVATSSSSMPFFPFFAPRPAKLATCSLKHKAENPSIKTLH